MKLKRDSKSNLDCMYICMYLWKYVCMYVCRLEVVGWHHSRKGHHSREWQHSCEGQSSYEGQSSREDQSLFKGQNLCEGQSMHSNQSLISIKNGSTFMTGWLSDKLKLVPSRTTCVQYQSRTPGINASSEYCAKLGRSLHAFMNNINTWTEFSCVLTLKLKPPKI